MFNREHHIHIATILQALDAQLLMDCNCLFGGGTAIVLSHGEYRESIDIDFLISDLVGYQTLRQRLKEKGLDSITRNGMKLKPTREIRVDQYGIRTLLKVAEAEIKLEIVYEGRISLEAPLQNERLCGVATLTTLDMATTKLLANSDRWSDDSVFSRDLIDLAMLDLPKSVVTQAVAKAAIAYGASIKRDLTKAIHSISERQGRLDECMTALQMSEIPKALLWKRIRALREK